MQTVSPISRFQRQQTVRMVDTDASGNVHLGAYIRMMEETEYAFLRSRGLTVVLSDARGVLGFPRLSAQIEVYNPVGFDEEVLIELSLVEIDGKRISYEFSLSRLEGTPVAAGRFKIACCRFPPGEPPYAILTPQNVVQALTGRH